MSSSVGSVLIRSSWRWRRSSSPESLAPPSRETFFNLLSLSRRRSSCSLGGIEQPQEPGDGGAELGSRHDRVEMAEAEVLLGEPEVVRELLAGRLLDDAGAGEGDQRAGLGEQDVAEAGEAREHARGRRMRHDDDHRLAG